MEKRIKFRVQATAKGGAQNVTKDIEIFSINCENGVPFYKGASVMISGVPFLKNMKEGFVSNLPKECPVKKL